MTAPPSSAAPPHSRLRVLALINVAAGLWLITVPFAVSLPRTYPHQLSFLNFLVTGTAVLALSVLHALQWNRLRGASWGNVILGGWLALSPIVFGSTKYLPNAKTVALISVLTGLAVIGGGALALAGSDKELPRPAELHPGGRQCLAPSRGANAAMPSASALPRPALWPQPRPGEQPTAFRGRADAGHTGEAAARRKLPLAWTAVAGIIVAAVLLGLSLVLHNLGLGVAGAVLGLLGAALARKVRILADVSTGQSPEGP